MKRICIYCGSSPGADPRYVAETKKLGNLLADRNIQLIYGGAHVGVMGALADAVLQAGGRVTGVMPRFLFNKDVAHSNLTELKVVESMHERKMLMAELADAFIALPGGLGTLDEFFEVLTWGQLGLHRKPCGILNIMDYFARLIEFLDHLEQEQFLSRLHRSMILIEHDPNTLLSCLENYKSPNIEKWPDREQA